MSSDSDSRYMLRALELARRGEGFVEPNPMVGCVIVRDGNIVGEGWHQRFGGEHAEIEALVAAGRAAAGAAMYVTLEPCCHYGKTPPCTEAIVPAGIKRVVCAMRDPFPKVAGGGFKQLEAAGIAPEKITRIVFTHLHADHLWGAIDDFDDAPRYPNATYVISAAEWDFWNDPKTAETAPDWLKGMAIGTARMLKKLESKVERRKPGEAVGPGLTYVDSSGHTPGHYVIEKAFVEK